MERGRREFRKSFYLWNTRVSDCGGLTERDKEARQDLDKSWNVEKNEKEEKKRRKKEILREKKFFTPDRTSMECRVDKGNDCNIIVAYITKLFTINNKFLILYSAGH